MQIFIGIVGAKDSNDRISTEFDSKNFICLGHDIIETTLKGKGFLRLIIA